MSKHNKVDAFANFDNAIKEAFRYKKRAKRLRKKVIELQAQIKGLEGVLEKIANMGNTRACKAAQQALQKGEAKNE